MAINGIHSLIYGVEDIATSARFFDDFGLRPGKAADGDVPRFELPEGSQVILRHRDDPALPASSLVGDGVQEVIWGVDTQAALDALVGDLSSDRAVSVGPDGVARFVTDFGLAMGLALFAKIGRAHV